MAEFNEITNGTPNDANEVRENFNYLKCIYEEVGLNHIRQLKDRAIEYPAINIGGYAEYFGSSTGNNATVNAGNTTAEYKNNEEKYVPATTDGTAENKVITTNSASTTLDIDFTIINEGYFSSFVIRAGSTGNQTIEIKVGSETIYSEVVNFTVTSGQTVTLDKADYSRMLQAGETATLTTSGSCDYSASESYTGTNFSYSSQNVMTSEGSGNTIQYTPVTRDSSSVVEIDLPSNKFTTTITKAILIAFVEDWETDAAIDYRVFNASAEDSGWITFNEAEEFTEFVFAPTKIQVRLTQKSSSPTSGYPSIKGVYYNLK